MHPADLQGGRTNGPQLPTNLSATQSPNSYGASAYPSPLSPNQPRGMSVAQRLYASSQSFAAAPMISANDISSLSTSLDVSGRPSPQSRSRTFPSPSLPTFPGNQDSQVASHCPPQRQMIDEGRLTTGTPEFCVLSNFAGPTLYGDRLNNRYRSPTSPPVVFPSHTIHGRQHALSSPMPQINYSGNSAVSPPRQTPHLITKAKPPPDSSNPTDLLITKFPALAPPPSPLSPLNLNPTSPPSTSLLFAAPTQEQSLSPTSPPIISVSPISGVSMAGSTAALPNAHNITQQLPLHQETMDALKNQEAALVAQQAVINQQAQQQALLKMQLLQQQQQVLAQQQLQAMQHQIAHHQQQAIPQQPAVPLQTVQQPVQQMPMQQITHVPAQLSIPAQQVQHVQAQQQNHNTPAMMSMASGNSQHQGQQQPTSQLFGSVMSSSQSGSQQQSAPNTNSNTLVSQVTHQVMTHLVDSFMGNGSNQGDSTSSTTSAGATDCSAAGGGWDSFAQTLNGVIGGNNQDPSQGLFGGQTWMDGMGNMDLGSLSTGGDFSEC